MFNFIIIIVLLLSRKYFSNLLGLIFRLIKSGFLVNNLKIPYVFTKRRLGDMTNVVADNKKAIQLLNWQPTRNIENMCRDGWRWKTLNPKGYL